jgi:hypothetical protein
MPRAHRRLLLGLPVLVLLAAGCSEELGPPPMQTSHVRGIVRNGNRPIVRGWIEFRPFPGTVGNLRVAQIGSDGSFDATGVAIGKNVIDVVHASTEPKGSGPAGRFPIFLREIPDQPENTLTIDLFEEAMRRQSAQVK